MARILLAALFLILVALNVGGYLYFTNEIDGSTVKTRTYLPSNE